VRFRNDHRTPLAAKGLDLKITGVERESWATPKEKPGKQAENTATAALSALGTSIWLDDLTREGIKSGGACKGLIADHNVVGSRD
jgi:hypothetical protein